MVEHRWSIVAIALCLQCGGSTQPAAPVEEPLEPESTEETSSTPPTGEEAAESTESSTEGEASETKDESKPADAKKPCAELKQGDCKVTLGCAWSDKKKCVEEGASE